LIYEKFTSLRRGTQGVITPGQGTSKRGGRLSAEELVPGAVVTVSENKRVADRSLVDAVWEIIAVNEAHCVLKFDCGNPPLDPAFLTRVVPLQEHDFYQADDLAAALKGELPIARIVRIRER
jgi:hypothetical protein